MELCQDRIRAWNVALNELQVMAFQVDTPPLIAKLTLLVLPLMGRGQSLSTHPVVIRFSGVERVVAQRRVGSSGGLCDRVERVRPADIENRVAGFPHLPISGWNFFDHHESADFDNPLEDTQTAGHRKATHSFAITLRGEEESMDICLWFKTLTLENDSGAPLDEHLFCETAVRRWTNAGPISLEMGV